MMLLNCTMLLMETVSFTTPAQAMGDRMEHGYKSCLSALTGISPKVPIQCENEQALELAKDARSTIEHSNSPAPNTHSILCINRILSRAGDVISFALSSVK